MKPPNKIIRSKQITLLIFLFIVVTLSITRGDKKTAVVDTTNAISGIDTTKPIYGITVASGWSLEDSVNLQQVVDAIKAMSVIPTVRIVIPYQISPEDFVEVFKKIHTVAYVMAQPVDSYFMHHYRSVEAYLQRFKTSYKYLSPYADMWEVANEINGEGWLGGSRQFNADKMYAAYKFLKEKDARTFLTGYETAPGDHEMSMLDWLKIYIPDDMKKGLDYMSVSYYEDDNHGFQPNWQNVFDSLQTMFPNSILAIGECGHRGTIEEKISMIEHYYNMPKYVEHYKGGYFWWYWARDCVPYESNPVWEAMNTAMKEINWK